MSASREEVTKAILFDGLLAECQDRSAEIERLRAQIAELVAALEGTIQPMILLGDFIGNEFPGKVGIPSFDRCAAIGAARSVLKKLKSDA